MSTSVPNPPQNEVDIIEFFRYVGKFFSKIGRFFRSLFGILFDILLFRPFSYYKRYKKIIGLFLLSALILGIIADSNKKTIYRGELLVTPHYDSGKELYTRIEMYNNLAQEENYEKLSELLGISKDTVEHYLGFEIKPNINERIFIRSFDEFTRIVDSTTLKKISYDTYKETFKEQEFDYPQHIIYVKADRPDVLKPLNRFFDNLLGDLPLFQKRKNNALKLYDSRINYILQTIAQTDSLRKAINNAIENMGKGGANGKGNNIIVGGTQIKFPEKEYDLFQEKKKLVENLTKLKGMKIEADKILLLNSYFPDNAPVYSPFWQNYKLSFVVTMLILLLLIFYFIDLLTYLNRKYHSALNGKEK